MNIFDMLTVQAIAANWTEVQSNKINYLGESLFPADKKLGLDLSWIKVYTGLPVSLMPSAFDAKATFRDRPGVSKTETEMPFFREGFKLKEKDRQDLLRIQDSNDPYLKDILRHVFNDAQNLIESARIVPERMRMALLFPEDGKPGITIKANGVDYTYEYDHEGEWKATNYFDITSESAKKWSESETADPFVDIETVKNEALSKHGTNLTRLIMNSTTFNQLMKIKAVRDRFLTTNGLSVSYLTRGDVGRVFRDTNGVSFVVYDKQYKDESGETHKFVPDGYISFQPDGTIGKTWYGTTPEEADLLHGGHDVSIVNTGVALLRTVEEHPVGLNIFASEIVLPSFERMDEVYLMKVL